MDEYRGPMQYISHHAVLNSSEDGDKLIFQQWWKELELLSGSWAQLFEPYAGCATEV
jgi:hypothetical protein